MITFPNAKINLGLNIVSKRPDGYHNIETLFYPIPLRDLLEIVPAEDNQDRFFLTGIPIDENPEKNLVIKALHHLRNDFDIPAIHVYLRKIIPLGAGLGGGSADASFMLKLLNDSFDLKLSIDNLENYASRLGADCPFFIQNKPIFAEGIGNDFSPIELSLKGLFMIVVKPNISVSTAEAYSAVLPKKPEISIKEIIKHPILEWKHLLKNDFEESIFPKYPQIEKIKNDLYEMGALYACMSGSGSSVFGIFEQLPKTQNQFEAHQVFSFSL